MCREATLKDPSIMVFFVLKGNILIAVIKTRFIHTLQPSTIVNKRFDINPGNVSEMM